MKKIENARNLYYNSKEFLRSEFELTKQFFITNNFGTSCI